MHQLSEIPRLRRSSHDAYILIVIAPDSFKESLTASEAAWAIQRGIQKAAKKVKSEIRTILLPLSDGGEGCRDALVGATGGRIVNVKCHDPLMRSLKGSIGVLSSGKTVILDMASASGLSLLKQKERNPMITTTFGTGDLIKAALDHGVDEIITGIGGSATVDGGTGAAQALGCRFFDHDNNLITQALSGGQLRRIKEIDLVKRDSRIDSVNICVACDVDNPFTGPGGAANVYAPQKGASPEEVTILEENLLHLEEIIRRDIGIDLKHKPGSGASGGLGGGLHAFLDAQLSCGINLVLKVINFREKIRQADLIITGEGKLDTQTLRGKVIKGVCMEAKNMGVPVIALAGIIEAGYEPLFREGLSGVQCINPETISLKEAMENAAMLLEKTAGEVIQKL